MADLLDSIQRQLRERLDELRPLVSEYERLQAAEAALGAGAFRRPTSADRGGERGSQPRRRAGGRTSTSASREANREKVLALVGERPGITKAELREAAGLTGAGVAQNLRRLLASGQLREEALPAGQSGYRVSEAAEAPSAPATR
jgi:hypothetical protein